MKFGEVIKNGKERVKSLGASPVLKRYKMKIRVAVLSVVVLFIIIYNSICVAKTEESVNVVSVKSGFVQGSVILDESNLVPYPMKKNEYENYSLVQNKGVLEERLVKWEDRNNIIGLCCAVGMLAGHNIEYQELTKQTIDSTNMVLHTFPGKQTQTLEIQADELNAYKKILKPGSKININVVYKNNESMSSGRNNASVDTIKVKTGAFVGLTVSDILNPKGDSVLDFYTKFNRYTKAQQEQIEKQEEFKEATKCQTLFVCLTPYELERYYLYKSQSDCQFYISLPQAKDE